MKKSIVSVILPCLLAFLLCACGFILPKPSRQSASPSIVPSSTPIQTANEPSMTPEPTITPTPKPSINLIAEADIPTPETGQWYEWDKAGTYPGNNNLGSDCGIFYIQNEDILITAVYSSLIVSHLDGTGQKVLDNCADRWVNYYNGWIFYLKEDGLYKIKQDGNGKQMIINSKKLNENEDEIGSTVLQVYDSKIYYNALSSMDTNGTQQKHQKIPDVPVGQHYFDKGYYYYSAVGKDEEGGDCWSIYKYNLKTESVKELYSSAMGSLMVKDDKAYYIDYDELRRTDGKRKELVLAGAEAVSGFYYTLYRNFIIYFADTDDGQTLHACDINTGKENRLFSFNDSYIYDFCVSENSIFLIPNNDEDKTPILLITFENDKARLWELNGLMQGDN